MVGVAAILLHGYRTDIIRSFLNLGHNAFVLYRSNIRDDIWQIFRTLTHKIGWNCCVIAETLLTAFSLGSSH